MPQYSRTVGQTERDLRELLKLLAPHVKGTNMEDLPSSQKKIFNEKLETIRKSL